MFFFYLDKIIRDLGKFSILTALVTMTGFLTSCSVSDNAFNDENVDEIVLYIMIAIVAVVVIAGYMVKVRMIINNSIRLQKLPVYKGGMH